MLCSARLMWVWWPGGRDWLGSFAFRLAKNMQKAQVDQLSFMCLVPTCRETAYMYRYYTTCMCINLPYIKASSRNVQQSAQPPPSPLSAAALQSARGRIRFAFLDSHSFPKAPFTIKLPAKICERKNKPCPKRYHPCWHVVSLFWIKPARSALETCASEASAMFLVYIYIYERCCVSLVCETII